MGKKRTLTTTIDKDDLDHEFNGLKKDVYNIIEASVDSGQQEGAKQLAKNSIDRVRILMLRWFDAEKEGEYNAQRQRARHV